MTTLMQDDPIGAAARRLFNDIFDDAAARDHADGRDATDWSQCVEAGFVHALLDDDRGGIGLGLNEYFSTALAAGACASPLPVVHTALFLKLLSSTCSAEVSLPDGPITFAERLVEHEGNLRGVDVPWAQVSRWAVASTAHGVWLLPIDRQSSDARTMVCVGTTPAQWQTAGAMPLAVNGDQVRAIAATGYAALLAGVLERMLAMTLQYAGQRQQFGKPIGKFQAIQQQISAMAERVVAARMAAEIGFNDAAFAGRMEALAVGKAITSEVVPLAASVSHAVHGAIGVTHEYALHRYTLAAHRWRMAAGAEAHWRRVLGARVLADDSLPRDFLRTHLAGA